MKREWLWIGGGAVLVVLWLRSRASSSNSPAPICGGSQPTQAATSSRVNSPSQALICHAAGGFEACVNPLPSTAHCNATAGAQPSNPLLSVQVSQCIAQVPILCNHTPPRIITISPANPAQCVGEIQPGRIVPSCPVLSTDTPQEPLVNLSRTAFPLSISNPRVSSIC